MNLRDRFKRVTYCIVCHRMIPARNDQFCLKCMLHELEKNTGWPDDLTLDFDRGTVSK